METLTGTVELITYYNEENGYTVLKITPDQRRLDTGRDGRVAVVGSMPELAVGELVEFTGEWVEDKQYGRQFRAETVATVAPTSLNGIINYLGSGLVKGIGIATAQRIVDHFGLKTLEVLDSEPDRLSEVLKPQLAEKLADNWAKAQSVRQTMIYLQGYGVSSRLAAKIHNHYGEETIQHVKSDPYTLADEVYGVGFIKADTIAQAMGVAADAPGRIRAGLSYTLNQMAGEGHVYVPKDKLIEAAAEILKINDRIRIELVLGPQVIRRDLIAERMVTEAGEVVEAIYLPMFYHSERRAAQRLHRLKDAPSKLRTKALKRDWPSMLSKLTDKSQITLTEQQQDAVRAALTNKISVLTGGPGTGKTTTLRTVIEALNELHARFSLTSPTGRAAKRLSESTGYPASTIHRLLGYSPAEGFMRDEDEPLDVDMVIVDETSMVDLLLLHNLLKALKPETHLMLVGDVNQLPSVGAGNVLHDVIESGIAHVTRLETIFRQDQQSQIVLNAYHINHGEQPLLDNSASDFFFFGADDPTKAAELVVDIVQNRLPAKFGIDPIRDVQVIAPMYRGPCGVDALNTLLQKALNGKQRTAEKQIGGRLFRAGDKVMQTRNNYDKEVFNGDIGRIYGIDFEDSTFDVIMDDGMHVDYEWKEAEELRHAYCISTHRSQGSEYPIVVIPVLTQHYMMLQRNLLYTAITRAKQRVVLVGSRRAVAMAVGNNKVSERYSGLMERLREPVPAESEDDDEFDAPF